jgi:hypothetical protein
MLAVALTAQQPAGSQEQPTPSQGPRVRGNNRPTDPNVPTTVSTNLPGHPSPPQPRQQQGLEYLVGTWNFSWIGRESPITAGPRSGTASFTRIGESNFMRLEVQGNVDGGGAFKENGVLAWNPDKMLLAFYEKTATGAEMLSVGDWSSPLGIRFDTQPLVAQGKTIKLRRSYAILSATSFTIKEELSTDEGPFVRLGVGSFAKAQ